MTWRIHDPKNGLWFEVVSDDLMVSFQLATEFSAKNLVDHLNQPFEIGFRVQGYLQTVAQGHVDGDDTDDARDEIWSLMSKTERDLANKIVSAVFENYL